MTRAEQFVLSSLPGPGSKGRTFTSLYQKAKTVEPPLNFNEIADVIRSYLSQGFVEDTETHDDNGFRRYYTLTVTGWKERGKLPGMKRMPKAEGVTA